MKIDKKLLVVIYAGCGFSLLLVLAVGAISLYFSERQKQKELWVEHTYQVLGKVHNVHRHLYEMGIDKQRYRITQSDDFAQSYNRHSDSLLAELGILKMLIKDNAKEIENVNVLRRNIMSLLNFWQNESNSSKNFNANLRDTWIAKAKIDSIGMTIARIGMVESKLLKQREKANVTLRERTELAIEIGTLLILILVCLLIYFILRELKNGITAYQKEKEMNELKSSFVSLASHEFRTPLTSIFLSASLVERYLKSDNREIILKHCQKIKGLVNNLNSILEDFLSLDKLNAGKIKALNKPFDLVGLCEEIMEEMRDIAGPDQTLRFEHAGIEKIVKLDQNLVRNAIINLVNNSIKYAGANAVITLKADISTNYTVLAVKDNGAGIAEQNQKELFTPFYRVNGDGKIPGTGLGLSIVQRYVNLMNGKISFSSIPYKETYFEMSFPSRF